MQRISTKTFFVLTALCVSACQADGDEQISQTDAEEVAVAVAALTSEEIRAMQNTFTADLQNGTVNGSLTVSCQDANGAEQSACNAETDRAEVVGSLDASFEVPNRLDARAVSSVNWVGTTLRTRPTINGTTQRSFEGQVTTTSRKGTVSFDMQSVASGIEIDLASGRAVAGSWSYQVVRERSGVGPNGTARGGSNVSVEVIFSATGTTVTVEGSRTFEMNMEDGSI